MKRQTKIVFTTLASKEGTQQALEKSTPTNFEEHFAALP
jgi:hypothetical protein